VDTLTIQIALTTQWWRLLGAADARKKVRRPLPGIADIWVKAYLQGFEKTLTQHEKPENTPFKFEVITNIDEG
jgi:hypothetical protein